MQPKRTSPSVHRFLKQLCCGTSLVLAASATAVQAHGVHPTESAESAHHHAIPTQEHPSGVAQLRSAPLPSDLVCPAGTTFNESASTPIKLVCDIDTGGSPTQDIVYPLPTDGTIGRHINETDLPPLVNAAYPDWYRNNGGGNHATPESHHHYYELIGPGLSAPSYDTENIYCSSYYLKPGKTYFAHNHPAREFYYVISGTADWYIGDEGPIEVSSGYMMVHPPYVTHGMTNTSDTEDLRALVCWWQTPDDPENVMNTGGLPANPCSVEEEATAKPNHFEPVCPAE